MMAGSERARWTADAKRSMWILTVYHQENGPLYRVTYRDDVGRDRDVTNETWAPDDVRGSLERFLQQTQG
jgi:hypothetical protein